MKDLIARYNDVFEKRDTANLGLKTADVSVGAAMPVDREDIYQTIAEFSGPGWVETTDAVWYRKDRNEPWNAPSTGEKTNELDQKYPILNAEIMDGLTTVILQHHHGSEWLKTILKEDQTGTSPYYDTESFGVVISRQVSPNAQLMLRHRTYWDPKSGGPKAIRFVGFATMEVPDDET